jgi:hypothetical protein
LGTGGHCDKSFSKSLESLLGCARQADYIVGLAVALPLLDSAFGGRGGVTDEVKEPDDRLHLPSR